MYKIRPEFDPETKKFIGNLLYLVNKEGVASKLDEAAFTLLADAYNKYITTQKILLKQGYILKGKAHPASKLNHESQVELLKLLIEFGLTPKRRPKDPKPPKAQELSPIEQFINGKREVR